MLFGSFCLFVGHIYTNMFTRTWPNVTNAIYGKIKVLFFFVGEISTVCPVWIVCQLYIHTCKHAHNQTSQLQYLARVMSCFFLVSDIISVWPVLIVVGYIRICVSKDTFRCHTCYSRPQHPRLLYTHTHTRTHMQTCIQRHTRIHSYIHTCT